MANGALDATPQRDQNGRAIFAGQQAFGLEQRGVPSGGWGTVARILFPLGLIARAITLASAQVYYEPDYGQTTNVLHAYHVLNGGHWQEATGPAGSCGLDGAAGGFRYFFSSITDNQNSTGVFQMRHFYAMRDKACFIPTRSALGYTQPADNCQAAGANLVCNSTTPFDAYYGPTGHNEEHIQLTPANVDFIRNEILKTTPKPVFQTAPLALCPNGSPTTYSVNPECVAASRNGYTPPGTTYTWTPGAGLVLVSGQGTATVAVQPTPGFTGTATLRVVATRAGYAASAPLQTLVRVGDGYVQLSGPTGPECYYNSLTYDLTSSLTQGNVVWHVYLDNTLRDDFIEQDFGASLVVKPTETGNMQVTATDGDACAAGQPLTASTSTTIVSQMRGPGGQISFCPQYRPAVAPQVAAYPNPADATLHLVPTSEASAAEPVSATLYKCAGAQGAPGGRRHRARYQYPPHRPILPPHRAARPGRAPSDTGAALGCCGWPQAWGAAEAQPTKSR